MLGNFAVVHLYRVKVRPLRDSYRESLRGYSFLFLIKSFIAGRLNNKPVNLEVLVSEEIEDKSFVVIS